MAAQNTREQEVRAAFSDPFSDWLETLAESCETEATRWLRNVRIPPADEAEQGA